jgi:hypothetical protein
MNLRRSGRCAMVEPIPEYAKQARFSAARGALVEYGFEEIGKVSAQAYRSSLPAASSSRLPFLAYRAARRAWRTAIAFCPRRRACPLSTHWRPTTA